MLLLDFHLEHDNNRNMVCMFGCPFLLDAIKTDSDEMKKLSNKRMYSNHNS